MRYFKKAGVHTHPALIGLLSSQLILGGTLVQAASLTLEEVVVTAQKREQSLQDVPASVSVVQGDALEEFLLFDFSDVEQLTPGLNLDVTNGRNTSISLRGINYNPDSGAQSAVGVYWNEASVRSSVAFQMLYDIARIEVLRGPQGTLQGNTSPAGAIHINTRRPDMEQADGQLQTSLTDEDGSNTQFGAGLPLIPGQLAVRVAGLYDENPMQGIKNLSGTEQSSRSQAGRLTLEWQPGKRFSATLIAEYLERDINAFEDVEGSDIFGDGGPTLDSYDRTSLADGINHSRNRNTLSALLLDWELNDHRLSSVTSYQESIEFDYRELDHANAVPNTKQNQWITTDARTFSQELRLATTEQQFWEYTVGLYYLNSATQTDYEQDTAPNNHSMSTLLDIPINNEEFGVFSHNMFHLTERLTAQVGVRWQKVRSFKRLDGFAGDGLAAFGLPRGTPLFTGVKDEHDSSSKEKVTGSLKLLFDLNDNSMIYGSLDRSYRTGGITIATSNLSEDTLLYDGETSDSLEFGFKSTLLDNRLQLNGAVYLQKFDNYIDRATAIFVDSDIDGVADTRPLSGMNYNADASILGAELEASALLTEHWQLFSGISYNDATFDSGAQSPCNVFVAGVPQFPTGAEVARCDVSDKRIGGEPNWSISINSEYTVPLNTTELYFRGLYKFTDSQSNDNVADVGGYGVVHFYTGVRDQAQRWDISLWAKNLFDKEALDARFDPENSIFGTTGYRKAKVIQQRTVGLTAKYSY